MDPWQQLVALVAALLAEGVTASQIEKAVVRVCDFPPGVSVTRASAQAANLPPALVRAFAFEQANRLTGSRTRTPGEIATQIMREYMPPEARRGA